MRSASKTSPPRERPIIYGIHPVVETVRAGRRPIYEVYVARDVTKQADVETLLAESRSRVVFLPKDRMSELAGSPHHQGIAARVGPFPYEDLDRLVNRVRADRALLIMLDGVQDPVNVGTILRSSECLGAYAVVLTKDRSARITPAAEKSASGASAHLPVARVTNLVAALEAVKKAGYWVYAADAAGGRPCHRVDLTGKAALVLGSEGKGIRRLVKDRCDGVVSIPMRGRIESLSVSQAATILLFESLRQRIAVEGDSVHSDETSNSR